MCHLNLTRSCCGAPGRVNNGSGTIYMPQGETGNPARRCRLSFSKLKISKTSKSVLWCLLCGKLESKVIIENISDQRRHGQFYTWDSVYIFVRILNLKVHFFSSSTEVITLVENENKKVNKGLLLVKCYDKKLV